jgi:hypothetical protein
MAIDTNNIISEFDIPYNIKDSILNEMFPKLLNHKISIYVTGQLVNSYYLIEILTSSNTLYLQNILFIF